MARLFIPFDDIRDLVLYASYVATVENNHFLIDGEALSKVLNNHVKPAILTRHFQGLQNDEKLLDSYNSSYKSVPVKLIRFVEDRIKMRVTPYFELHKYGPDWLLSKYAFDDQLEQGQLVPASDRLVTISDNDTEAASIASQARDLKQQIQTSNDLNMTIEEREAAKVEMDLVVAAFEPGTRRVDMIASLARQSLRWIADKAGGALVGAAAIALLGAILAYLGLVA